MKKFLFLICFLPSLILAQAPLGLPEHEFKSVNLIQTVTNYLPTISPITAENPESNYAIRKVGPKPLDPYMDPVGDVPVLLFVCLFVIYASVKFKPRRKIFGV